MVELVVGLPLINNDKLPEQMCPVCTQDGHFLHFTRISAGVRVHLHYDNPLGSLTDIKRVVESQAVAHANPVAN